MLRPPRCVAPLTRPAHGLFFHTQYTIQTHERQETPSSCRVFCYVKQGPSLCVWICSYVSCALPVLSVPLLVCQLQQV
jgi:hypothetical protein